MVTEENSTRKSLVSVQKQTRTYTNMETGPRAEVYTIPAGDIAVYLNKLAGKLTPNEDSAGVFVVNTDCALAVADGMGGMPAGAQASQIIIETLSEQLHEQGKSELGYRESLLTAIESANKSICELGVGAGSTAAVVEIADDVLRSYHVGDSQILVVGQRGKIKFQSISHSPVGYALESGLLDEDEALHHEDRHLISNYLGSPDMRIDIGPTIRLAHHDTVLVASDGLFDNLQLDELVGIIRKGKLSDVAQKLIELIGLRMEGASADLPSKPDDVSFVLFRRGK